jgi:hypothetical protein
MSKFKLTPGRKAFRDLARAAAGKLTRLRNRIGLLESSPGNDGRIRAVRQTAAELVELLDELAARRCLSCGCSDQESCVGGCAWVGPELCSSCKEDGHGNQG